MAKNHKNPEPAPLLRQFLQILTDQNNARALDFASGYGRNSFFMAKNGYTVDGFDRNQDAIDFCNAQSKNEKLSFTAHHADLEQALPFQEKVYDVATVFYYLDRNIMPSLKRSLKVGGLLIYETFLIDQHHQFGHPSRRAFCWEHNELLRALSDFRVHHYYEGMIFPESSSENATQKEGTWVAQIVAERKH